MAFIIKNLRDTLVILNMRKAEGISGSSGIKPIELAPKELKDLSQLFTDDDLRASSGVLSHARQQGHVTWSVEESLASASIPPAVIVPEPPPEITSGVVAVAPPAPMPAPMPAPRRGRGLGK